MSEKNLIPELRFPAFEKDGEWTVSSIDKLCDILNNIRKPVTSTNRTAGPYPYYGASGIIDFIDKFLFDERLLLIGEDGAKWGAYDNTAFLVEGKYWVNNHAHVLKPIGIDEKLLESYLVKLDLNPYITGAAPPKLTLRKLKEIPVPVPSTPEEQQKIASCLSSLDELIAAHNDKLDALKDHKKGLLQNLFPQEGETVPKVRFKEFEDDGAWVEKRLGIIGEPLMCKRIFKDQTTPNPENGIPFYKIGTFGNEPDAYIPVELYEEFKSKYNFPNKGDILISASGTIGRLVVYDGAPAYFQDSNIVWLGHDGKQVTNDFLYHCYKIVNWQTSDGGVIKRLYNSDLKAIPIKFPENEIEQEKIASCLSAIDELITAQTEKIAQLHQHKKGLMQGLFPKIER